MAREQWQGKRGDPTVPSTGQLLGRVEVIADQDGFTELHIPPPCFWDCVDCLGENRLEASFTYLPPHFVARIARAPVTRIHEALRNWGAPDPADNRNERENYDEFLEG